ncbi:dihydrofolate synthase / folylpolyglutamate synthase [Paramicrobacterium humi]|uniref:tetrahydrofolate synthase n=1 Tax=Paramicrobacterium humi TaxID=640635 RepID=A0A1H4Q8B4_9MICO|nr:folylpolyglutamate synthase/dihydrofolate synthase family protein [Microbacterium humi]SEC15873.1 dihydrofolate synthase / folylpolyglutamate synthase [Microbacterium humi]
MPESSIDDARFADEAADAIAELYTRVGEGRPAPRLDATRRAMELLGDPQTAYPIIQLTGTNGKTSTARFTESLLRAHGLRTGLFTSPHLRVFNERISIDGEPISDEKLATNWQDVKPYIELVDAELQQKGDVRLTFFEALTVLAFASFADAPVDVAVIEVGMGGEWDSTNVADAQVAVFTPIDIDHAATLGSTITEIARTKAGIIKPGARVVTSVQAAAAMAEIESAVRRNDAELYREDKDFVLSSDLVAVGGQQISVTGRAGTYTEQFLPVFGDHQGHNAALAIAVVETFLGNGSVRIADDVLAQGLAEARSPGRLELASTEPPTLVDAAHNPHGVRSLVAALDRYFDVDEIAFVMAVLADKDVPGILAAVLPKATRVYATQVESERALSADELAVAVAKAGAGDRVAAFESVDDALYAAREWAGEQPRRMVVVAGSIILAGETLLIADDRDWA